MGQGTSDEAKWGWGISGEVRGVGQQWEWGSSGGEGAPVASSEPSGLNAEE